MMLLILFLVALCIVSVLSVQTKPNIVFFLVDDVGFSDVEYCSMTKTIPTPFINKLASTSGAVRLNQYYAQSLCTPTRASLLTGRYAYNVGLTFVIIPASPSGIPSNIETLPEILEREGYRSYILGKWHLGHGQVKSTPTHKGFHKFLGIYTWDIDSYSKINYLYPRIVGGTYYYDWLSHTRGSEPRYYLETEHATAAITKETINMIDDHVTEYTSSPLFLYIAYTAAHSPLIAEPRHEEKCSTKHLWRKQFCGLVVGIDESMSLITQHVIEKLGKNTIIVFSSDNGGSSWFGGLNYPLRGSKNTPFEGGIRVPGFIVDFRKNVSDTEYNGLFHVSDMLPTLLSLSYIDKEKYNYQEMDGLDHSIALYSPSVNTVPVRTEVLLELRLKNFTTTSQDILAMRVNNYKLIVGGSKEDGNYYLEPTEDSINIKDKNLVSYFFEKLIRIGEYFIGTSEFDSLRIVLTHHIKSKIEKAIYKNENPSVMLFDLENDPYETTNVAEQYPDIVISIKKKIDIIKNNNKVVVQNPLLQYSLVEWPKTFIKGNCSSDPIIPPDKCLFSVPWISDDVVDPFDGTDDFQKFINFKLKKTFLIISVALVTGLVTIIAILSSTIWVTTRNNIKKKA